MQRPPGASTPPVGLGMTQTQNMATLGQPKGIPHYPCPMCGSPVYSSALHCPSCGTDLTRAGVVFSSSGSSDSPVELKSKRRPGVWVALIGVLLFAFAAAAVTVGRPWVEPYASPGMRVAKAAAANSARSAASALHAARKFIVRLPNRIRAATKPQNGEGIRATANVKRTSVPPAPAKPAVTIPPVAATPVTVTPTAPAPPPATLTISSTPRAARVQIDGVARGVTPLTLSQLGAGPHRVRVSREGYRPVVRTVRLEPGKTVALGVKLPAQTPPKAATALKKPAPVQSQTSLLEVGRPAPLIAAKDRIGLIYRTADYRGRKLLLVFVPTLDGNAKRIIRELNALRSSEAVSGAMVVIVQPDRTAIRQFVLSEHIQVPILFGTPAVARAYRISGQQAVLYVVSEQGYVVRRQAGRIDPRAVAN